MSIVIDSWHGGRKAQEQLPLSDHGVTTAIGKLDGEQTTALTITVGGDMLIIGGGAGKYIVTGWMAGQEPHDLVGDPRAAGEIPMVVGGQLAPHPARRVVAADQVLKVARYFSETGQMDEGEVWERP